jgi:hypothetical protein
MARKRKRIWASEEERAAHEARVDEHIRRVHERAESVFAKYGERRPTDIVAYVRERYAGESGSPKP